MKVIREGNARPDKRTWTVQCDNCNTVLEIDEDDVTKDGELRSFLCCPVCNNRFNWKCNILEGEDVPLTHNYPEDFDDNTYAVPIDDNNRINEWIDNGIKHLRDNPDDFVWYTGTGNTLVFVFNYPDDREYYIVVSKNYMDAHSDYALDDYMIDWDQRAKRVWGLNNSVIDTGKE